MDLIRRLHRNNNVAHSEKLLRTVYANEKFISGSESLTRAGEEGNASTVVFLGAVYKFGRGDGVRYALSYCLLSRDRRNIAFCSLEGKWGQASTAHILQEPSEKGYSSDFLLLTDWLLGIPEQTLDKEL